MKKAPSQSGTISLVCQCGHTLSMPVHEEAHTQQRIRHLEEQLRIKDQQIEALIMTIKQDQVNKTKQLPAHYVLCTKVGGIVRKRSDSIARSLKTAHYPVVKANNKYYCDPEHATVLFPKWKKYWKKKNEKI